jgi:hypothetical protein
VTGKAFYDIGHAPADHSNRRTTPKDYAVWEIHPVMKLEVVHTGVRIVGIIWDHGCCAPLNGCPPFIMYGSVYGITGEDVGT